ncbi:MAG TPA: cytochrome c [Polyangiaceae bacterium]|nr:cytochrome c [Polyangiaceae bacterium]
MGQSPSRDLVSAALAGLLGIGLAAGCDSTPAHTADSSGPSSGGAPAEDAGVFSRVVSTKPITFDEFSKLCEDRGGFVTTSASCATSNLCRGLSFMTEGNVLTEHSCKGQSNCSGMSCVDLPKGSGLTGQEIYESGPCSGCHNDAVSGPSKYIVFVRPGDSEAAALQTFRASSDLRLESIVAFGTQGVSPEGIQFSNMPSFREKYSRKEIESVVQYLRGLEAHTKVYDLPYGEGSSDGGAPVHPETDAGAPPDSNPDAGAGPPDSGPPPPPPPPPPADAGATCRAIADACTTIDPGVGPVHDCVALEAAGDAAACSAQYEGCRSLCGASICVRLGSVCHDVDPGSGPIHDCHVGGHAGIADWCFDNAVSCFDLCAAAAAGL